MTFEIFKSDDGTYPGVEDDTKVHDIRGNMDESDLNTWIEALNSDEFIQGNGELCSFDKRYCCLGVYLELDARKRFTERSSRNEYWEKGRNCEMLGTEYAEAQGFKHAGSLYGKNDDLQTFLANANDNGWSFKAIAKFLDLNRYWITGEWLNVSTGE